MPTPDAAKGELRARLRAARRARSAEDRARAAAQLTALVLAMPELVGVDTVAAYVSGAVEPATGPLLDAFAAHGTTVLLPILQPDLDLDWAAYAGSDALAPSAVDGRRGLLEPVGTRLGHDAVRLAGLVLVPALAIGAGGLRLGQGGGSYDRVLARIESEVPVAALLYEGELLDDVPAESHDRRVTLVVLPSGVVRFA